MHAAGSIEGQTFLKLLLIQYCKISKKTRYFVLELCL